MRTASENFATATRFFLLTTLEELGAKVRDQFRQQIVSHAKTTRHDLVTVLDQQIQDELSECLRHYLPGSSVFAEEDFAAVPLAELAEQFAAELTKATALWVVDPIDGTSNFVHGFPFFAISVALWQQGQLTAAAVVNPVTGEAFSADLTGAYFAAGQQPEQRLDITAGRAEDTAALTTSHPAAEVLGSRACEHLAVFAELVSSFASVRRPICASLELCYVAAGFSDATLAVDSKPWDAAAGALIAAQAGVPLVPYWYGAESSLPGFAAPCYVAAAEDYPTLNRAAKTIARIRAAELSQSENETK